MICKTEPNKESTDLNSANNIDQFFFLKD